MTAALQLPAESWQVAIGVAESRKVTVPVAADEVTAALTGWFGTDAAPHAEAVADLNVLAFALIRTHRPAEAGRARVTAKYNLDINLDRLAAIITEWAESSGKTA